MLKPVLRSLSVVLIVFTFFAILHIGAHNARGDNTGWDNPEAIKNAAETLDRVMKEEARERKYGKSDDSDSGPMGVLILSGIIIAVGWAIIASKRKKEATQARETKRKQEQKKLHTNRLAHAISLGFSVENEIKKCPACAEKIKLEASTCRYCKKEFLDDQIDIVIQDKIDNFLADHKSA